MKILLCFGTRPEAIKMAPLYHELKKTEHEVKVCVTAQHRQMLDQVLDFFEIKPDFDLNLMEPNQSLNKLCSKILDSIDQVLMDEVPDLVLVHGDTTTSSMVALAAFHRQIKVGHIEAGLRTYNKFSPFPEELNRQVTGRIADFHFAPTQWAADNLLKERNNGKNIFVTGNTVIDALTFGLKKIEQHYTCSDLELVKSIVNPSKKMILITGHRRENFGKGFEDLCLAIKEIALSDDVQIIYPVHLNPNVQEPVNRILDGIENVHLIQPVDYPAFLFLMNNSYLILTDSGGVQEEAPSLGKPVLLLRSNTERPEALSSGVVRLVGTDSTEIVQNTIKLLIDKGSYLEMSQKTNPYGDGKASERIVEILRNK